MNRKIWLYIGMLICCSLLPDIWVQAQNLNNPNKHGPLGTEVNTMSGNIYIERTDIYIPSRMLDLNISFSYNSFLFKEDYGFGNGWTFHYNIRYANDSTPGSKLILWGDGREDKYDSLPGGGYKSPRGFFNSLSEYQAGKFLITEPNGLKFFFDDPQYKGITRMEEPNGNFISFTYTDSLLTGISNGSGQSINLIYNTQGRLASIVDAIATPARTFTYSYDAGGNLTEVKDPLNGKFRYSYLINGPMKDITDKNDNKVNIIYYPDLTAQEIIGCNKRMSFSYDNTSNTTVVTDYLDEGNQVTKYEYEKVDDNSWLVSQSGNCCGFNVNFEYDVNGNITSMTDANGNIYRYDYDNVGNMIKSTDPLGGVNIYTYENAFNKISSHKDEKGNLYTMSYDSKGNLIQLVAPGNLIFTASYNALGDIISSTNPKGYTFSYVYNQYGNPVSVNGPNGYNATLSFDGRGNLLAYTDALGNSNSSEYDILDRLKKITDPINKTVQFDYDAAGNLIQYKNQNNEIATFNYDAANNLVNEIDAAGNPYYLRYDKMGNLISILNPNGVQKEFVYDKLNRLKKLVSHDGHEINFEYDGNGNVTAAQLPTGRDIIYQYDELDRLISVTDDDGSIAQITYDKNSNVTGLTNGLGVSVSITYDNFDRIQSITNPLGDITSFNYDNNNNIISVTDKEGHQSFFTYDSLNRVKSYTDNNGFTIHAGYDAEGNVISLTDQNNNVTQYTYDAFNRRKRMIFPDGKYNEMSYDVEGNITQVRLTDGSYVTLQYDTLNRMTRRVFPDGETHDFMYDKLGRISSATNSNGTVTFTYDNLNRIITESFEGRTVNYSYNVSGRTKSIIYPDNSVVVKEFDKRNRLIKITKDSVLIASYVYNNINLPTTKTLGNNITSVLQYDISNRLTELSTTHAGAIIQNNQYAYDKENNKTSVTNLLNPSLSEQFMYDNGYRLIQYKRGPSGSPNIQNSYTYDAVGNRISASLNGVSTSYSINNLNQITAVNGISHVYDDFGNLIYDGNFHKFYDLAGRLVKDSASPSSVVTYSYDALARRVIKTVNGNTLQYTYSGVTQIEEMNLSNGNKNITVFTNFITPVINEFNGDRFYYHQNEMGSIAAITNNNGRLIETYQYDVYGKQSRFDSLNNPLLTSITGNRFGFTGQEYDSTTGSNRFFYRNYSPETGIFNQRDLIEYEDGMGIYQYVGNNPANGIDIWGLDCGDTKTKKKTEKEKYQQIEDLFKNTKKAREYLKKLESNELIGKEFKTLVKGFGLTLDIVNVPGELAVVTQKGADFVQGFDKRTATQNVEKGTELGLDASAAAAGTVIATEGIGYGVGKALVGPVLKGLAASTLQVVTVAKGIDNVSDQVFTNMFDHGVAEENADKLHKKLDNVNKRYRNKADEVYKQNEQYVEKFIKIFGKERKNWSELALEIDEVYQDAKKVREEWKKRNINTTYKDPCDPKGTRKERDKDGQKDSTAVTAPLDPNLIIGPDGVPDKKWVSVKDRMPYTILYENDSSATARARYIKITSPVEPKQDAGSFELGSVGFNNQSFEIPAGRSFYYQRLDAVDSTGVYVDLTAGYDVQKHELFWELRAIHPTTLMPPDDPNDGFLFMHDSTRPDYGHGFVNFTIKPKQDAITLDTIGAKAFIVFDENDTIPTNTHTNTIDAFAPTSQIVSLTGNGADTVTLHWAGVDDTNGSGIDFYTIYVTNDQVNYSVLFPRVTSTDTSFTLPPGHNYCFFVLATDRVGNMEQLQQGVMECITINGPVPLNWLYFSGVNQDNNNLLKWGTNSEFNSKEFILERSFDGQLYQPIAVIPAAGNSSTTRDYSYLDRNIDQHNKEVFFYRIKQVDQSGAFSYSSIVRLTYKVSQYKPTIVYPNPNRGIMNILVGNPNLIGSDAVVSDINGRILKRVRIKSNTQSISLEEFVNGVYFIRLKNKETLRVIKQ